MRPGGVVLNLGDLDDASLGNLGVVGIAKGFVDSIEERYVRGAGRRVGGGALGARSSLEDTFGLLEAVAQLIHPVWAKGVAPVRAHRVRRINQAGPSSRRDISEGRGFVLGLIEVTEKQVVVSSGLPVEAAEVFLIGI